MKKNKTGNENNIIEAIMLGWSFEELCSLFKFIESEVAKFLKLNFISGTILYFFFSKTCSINTKKDDSHSYHSLI